MSVNTKHILLFEQFLIEKDAIEAAKDQIMKAQKKADKYTNKAAAERYDIKYKKEKLDFEQKKDTLQREIDAESDAVRKETTKAKLKNLVEKWGITKAKYKERIAAMKKGARINPAGGEA